jgi:hypothetical protein
MRKRQPHKIIYIIAQQYIATQDFQVSGNLVENKTIAVELTGLKIPAGTIFTEVNLIRSQRETGFDPVVSCDIDGKTYTNIQLYNRNEVGRPDHNPENKSLYKKHSAGGRVNRRAIKKKSLRNRRNSRSRFSRRK